jgi:hypothetical protein
LTPIANALFGYSVSKPQTVFDYFIHRWGVSRDLLRDTRAAYRGGGMEQVESVILNSQDVASFLVSPKYDPASYVDLCSATNIDQLLQSVIIDYRNDYMCDQIRRLSKTFAPDSVCAVIVGQNHVEGMHANLDLGPDYKPTSLSSPPPTGEVSFSDQILLASLLR